MVLLAEQELAVDRIIDDLRLVDPKIVDVALERLVEQGSEVLHYLRSRLIREQDETTRINLIRGIGSLCFEYDLSDETLAQHFTERLGDPAVSVYERATLAKNLGKVDRGASVQAVQEAADHPDLRVRANALESFAFLAQKNRDFGGDETIEILRLRLHDPHPRVKVNAAIALYFVHGAQQAGILSRLQSMSKSANEGERLSAKVVLDSFDLEQEALYDRFSSDSLFRTFLQFNILHFYK